MRAQLNRFALILVALYAVLQAVGSLQHFVRVLPETDFASFYDSVRDYWTTGDLYAPHHFINMNAPHVSVVLFTPLLVGSRATAALTWTLGSFAAFGLSLWMIRCELALTRARMAWLLAVVCASSAMRHQLGQGQLGPLLLLLVTLAWRATRRDTPSAPWWLAAAITVKPWLLGEVLAVRRPVAARTLLLGAGGVLVGIGLLGLAPWRAWLQILAGAETALSVNLSLDGALLRLHVPRTPWWGLVSVIVLALSASARSASVEARWLRWGLAGVLISPLGWTYYLLALVGPGMALGLAQQWPWRTRIGLTLLCLPPALAGSLYTLGALCLWSATFDRDSVYPRSPV